MGAGAGHRGRRAATGEARRRLAPAGGAPASRPGPAVTVRPSAEGIPTLAAQIVEGLKRAGITLVASLPDRWLGDLIARLDEDPDITHVHLAREDDGVGVCAGAYLGGRRAALVCQNAGVLLSANALGAFAHHHQIPFLVLAAQRGAFDDGFYYQMYKGRVTIPVLQGLGLPHWVIEGPEQFSLIEQGARQAFFSRLPVVLLLRRRALMGGAGASR